MILLNVLAMKSRGVGRITSLGIKIMKTFPWLRIEERKSEQGAQVLKE